ncbi:MAG: response regulator transcription factor [Bacteroidetes bacterium]|nr:response regulator transcription factor [Bacteroidota bacterium]
MKTNENKTLRIIIFDDNNNMRESIDLLLSTTDHLRLIAGFDSCKNLLFDIEQTNPDVILMDIDMPSVTGIEGVKVIRAQYPELPILMLTGFEDDDKVFNSLCAGANGYILKNAKMESLIHYIEEVHAGGAPMTPIIARKVLTQFAKLQPEQYQKEEYFLSDREKDVLQLLVKGKSYKMIADGLNISYETVHSHIRKIYQKLHVNSVGEAVSKTISRNILKTFFF